MKWDTNISEETMLFESRWERWQRQLKRGLIVVCLCSLVAFLTIHPSGQQIMSTGQAVGQTVWQFAERQFVHFFGPDLILRQRAAWTSARLKAELERLNSIERSSAQKLATLQSELPSRLQTQTAATQAIQALTAQLQQVHALRGTGVRTPIFTGSGQAMHPVELGALVMTYSDLQEQLGRDQQALRVREATLVQVHALQHETRQQLNALDSTLALFNELWRRSEDGQGEQALTTGELLALRTALQIEMDQAQEFQQARRTLEAVLAALNLPAAQPTPDLRNRTEVTYDQ